MSELLKKKIKAMEKLQDETYNICDCTDHAYHCYCNGCGCSWLAFEDEGTR